MKLREMLSWLNDAIRPPHVQGGAKLSDSRIDAMTTMAGAEMADLQGPGPVSAPVGWVPSQQDERPRH